MAATTSSIGVETVSNNVVTLQNGQYKLTGRIGDGHGAVKQGTIVSPRAHIHPTVAIYYVSCPRHESTDVHTSVQTCRAYRAGVSCRRIVRTAVYRAWSFGGLLAI